MTLGLTNCIFSKRVFILQIWLKKKTFFAYFAAFWKNEIIIVANMYPKNGPDYYNFCLLLIFHSFLGTKNRM